MSYLPGLINNTKEFPLIKFSIHIQCHQEYVKLILVFENSAQSYEIFYRDKGDDTLVQLEKYKTFSVQGEDYVGVLCGDSKHILTKAKVDKNLEIGVWYDKDYRCNIEAVDRVYESFKTFTQQLKKELYVYYLRLQVENVFQLRSILPCFDPKFLVILGICNYADKTPATLDFVDIVEMDHWKNAKRVELYGFLISIPIKHFCHFCRVKARVPKISADDIQTLVEVDFDAPRFCNFDLYFDNSDADVTQQLLNDLVYEKQSNDFGQNKREFCLNSHNIEISCPDLWKNHKHGDIRKVNDENYFQYDRPSFQYFSSVVRRPIVTPIISSQCAMLCFCNILIMEKIVQHLDFYDLQVLRKVSNGIRQCIDSLEPNPKLVAINIHLQRIGGTVVQFYGTGGSRQVAYLAPELPNHLDRLSSINFSSDLFLILKNQKSALKEFCLLFMQPNETSESHHKKVCQEELEYMGFTSKGLKQKGKNFIWKLNETQFVATLKTTLVSLNRLLPVETFTVRTRNPKTVAQILQYLDPSSLKKIEFGNYFEVPARDVRSIRELVILKQWQNAEELKIEKFVINCDVESLVHFAKVDILLLSISLENVINLKITFLRSSTIRQFKVTFVNSDVDDSIFHDNFLGDPFSRVDDPHSNEPNIWFFPYEGVMKDLLIRYYRNQKVFMFNRVQRQRHN